LRGKRIKKKNKNRRNIDEGSRKTGGQSKIGKNPLELMCELREKTMGKGEKCEKSAERGTREEKNCELARVADLIENERSEKYNTKRERP
jgi:hypothetical protein